MIANNEKKRDPAVPVPVVRLSPFVLIIESESDVDFYYYDDEGAASASSSYGAQNHANKGSLGGLEDPYPHRLDG